MMFSSILSVVLSMRGSMSQLKVELVMSRLGLGISNPEVGRLRK